MVLSQENATQEVAIPLILFNDLDLEYFTVFAWMSLLWTADLCWGRWRDRTAKLQPRLAGKKPLSNKAQQ